MSAVSMAGMPSARIVQAEMIRDVASTKMLDGTAGPPASGEEIVAQLERTAAERGAWPHVLVTDNGGPYRARVVKRCLKKHQVVHLFNEAHTPEHNPWVEHGHGEHQQEMMLDVWDALPDLETLRAELARATHTLDEARLRASRGWKTASDYDLGPPRAGPADPGRGRRSWDAELERDGDVTRLADEVNEPMVVTPSRGGMCHEGSLGERTDTVKALRPARRGPGMRSASQLRQESPGSRGWQQGCQKVLWSLSWQVSVVRHVVMQPVVAI